LLIHVNNGSFDRKALCPASLASYMAISEQEAQLSKGSGFAIGIAIGVAIGVAIHNIGVGIAIGVAIGLSFGVQCKPRKDAERS
jgi:zinc transporter ZupT